MTKELIKQLAKFGITIATIEYSYPKSLNDFGLNFGEDTINFKLKGEFTDDPALYENLCDDLILLNSARYSDNTAVKDLLGQLKMAMELTNE